MERESDFFDEVWKIALGIFLGGVLLWIAFEYRARYEVRQLEKALEQSAQEMRADAQHSIEQQGRREAQQVAQHEAQRAFEVERQRADAQRRIHAQRSERAKIDAWARFYQPSTQCLNEATVECGNQHMRARKEFERRYAAGDL